MAAEGFVEKPETLLSAIRALVEREEDMYGVIRSTPGLLRVIPLF